MYRIIVVLILYGDFCSTSFGIAVNLLIEHRFGRFGLSRVSRNRLAYGTSETYYMGIYYIWNGIPGIIEEYLQNDVSHV